MAARKENPREVISDAAEAIRVRLFQKVLRRDWKSVA
jgi:hypothetical protein